MLEEALSKCKKMMEYLENEEIIENDILIENNIIENDVPKLNQIFSNIKRDLIDNDYLDYKNKPYYSIFKENINIEYEEVLYLDLEKIFEDDFIINLKKNLVNLENKNFFSYLKNLNENPLFLFHINYDFLYKLEINNNHDSYLFYQKINGLENIEDIDIYDILYNEGLNFTNQISNLEFNYEESMNLNKKLNDEIDCNINEINNFGVLLKDIDKKLIMKDKKNNFLKSLDINISALEKEITNYKYEHKIQNYIDKRNYIENKINELELLKIENNKSNLFYKKENDINHLEINMEKETDLQIRELKNEYIKNLDKTKIEINEDYNKKYYNEIKIKTTLLKNELKKIILKKEDFIIKIKEIEEKEIKTKSKNEKKNKILSIRFQKIKDNFFKEIEILEEEKKKKEKLIEEKNNTFNEKIIIQNEKVNKKDEIGDLIKKTTEKQNNRKIDREKKIVENNRFIIEYNKKDVEIQEKITLEEENLNELNIKHFDIYKIFDNYNNQLLNLNKIKELVLKSINIKEKTLLNKKNISNDFLNFIKIYNKNINIKNDKNIKNNDYLGKLSDSLKNVYRLRDLINICDIKSKNDLFNINMLHLIDTNRNKYFKRNNSEYQNKDIDIYNENNLKIILKLYNQCEIEDISKDLKKMIYILK